MIYGDALIQNDNSNFILMTIDLFDCYNLKKKFAHFDELTE